MAKAITSGAPAPSENAWRKVEGAKFRAALDRLSSWSGGGRQEVEKHLAYWAAQPDSRSKKSADKMASVMISTSVVGLFLADVFDNSRQLGPSERHILMRLHAIVEPAFALNRESARSVSEGSLAKRAAWLVEHHACKVQRATNPQDRAEELDRFVCELAMVTREDLLDISDEDMGAVEKALMRYRDMHGILPSDRTNRLGAFGVLAVLSHRLGLFGFARIRPSKDKIRATAATLRNRAHRKSLKK